MIVYVELTSGKRIELHDYDENFLRLCDAVSKAFASGGGALGGSDLVGDWHAIPARCILHIRVQRGVGTPAFDKPEWAAP